MANIPSGYKRVGRTILVDRGWTNIKTKVKRLEGMGVKVGIRSTAGSQDGVRIVDYAVWNEFGTDDGRVPARPFMRQTADKNKRYVAGFISNLARQVLQGISSESALDRIGLMYQAKIRETIRESKSWAVPNATRTIKEKGSSTPLIDHGMLHGAIDYEKVRK